MTTSGLSEFAGKVGFCVGTGRCGTTLLAELVGRESRVAASHERERLGATFHMFCKWHGIAVDSAGFLHEKEQAVRADLATHDFSFESSALLSHSLEELFERFHPRFLLLIRNPADTVASFAVRDWFLQTPVRDDPRLPPTFQGGDKARHFLGRNIPHGEEFERWTQLTQIGRIAWFWQARNRAILEQFQRLPAEHCRVLRIEDLTFEHYQDVAAWLGWRTEIGEETFDELLQSRLNAGPNPPRQYSDWSSQEKAEFEMEVAEVSSAIGYEYRLAHLREGEAPAEPKQS